RELNAWAEILQELRSRSLNVGELAAEQHKDPIGALGKYALPRTPRPFVVSWDCADVFWPSLHDVIRTEDILPSLSSAYYRETSPRLRLRSHGLMAIGNNHS